MRRIDADAFIKRNAVYADREFDHPKYQETLREIVEKEPTISPDDLPPVGDWVEDRTEIYCPACGQRFTDEVMCCDIYGWPWLFCPKCGNRIGRSVDNDCN